MKKTKHFRLTFYESRGIIILEQRICFLWVDLVDDEGNLISFTNIVEAEDYLNREKRFGETYIITYKKVIE